MSTIKVKTFEWFDYFNEGFDPDEWFGYNRYKEINPVFNRTGEYQNRITGDVWIEVDGRAFVSETSIRDKRKAFNYTLQINDEKILTDREVKAMVELLNISRDSSVTKPIRERLYQHECAKQLREVGRSARKWMLRYNKD